MGTLDKGEIMQIMEDDDEPCDEEYHTRVDIKMMRFKDEMMSDDDENDEELPVDDYQGNNSFCYGETGSINQAEGHIQSEGSYFTNLQGADWPQNQQRHVVIQKNLQTSTPYNGNCLPILQTLEMGYTIENPGPLLTGNHSVFDPNIDGPINANNSAVAENFHDCQGYNRSEFHEADSQVSQKIPSEWSQQNGLTTDWISSNQNDSRYSAVNQEDDEYVQHPDEGRHSYDRGSPPMDHGPPLEPSMPMMNHFQGQRFRFQDCRESNDDQRQTIRDDVLLAQQREVQQKDEEIKRLKEHLSEFKKNERILKHSYGLTLKQEEELKRVLESQRSEKEGISQELQEFKAENEVLKADKKKLLMEADELQSTIQSLQREVKSYSSMDTLSQMKRHYEGLIAQQDNKYEAQISKLKEELNSYETKNLKQEENVKKLTKKIEESEKEFWSKDAQRSEFIDELTKRLEEERERYHKILTKGPNMPEIVQEWDAKLEESIKKQRQVEEMNKSLKEENADLKEQLFEITGQTMESLMHELLSSSSSEAQVPDDNSYLELNIKRPGGNARNSPVNLSQQKLENFFAAKMMQMKKLMTLSNSNKLKVASLQDDLKKAEDQLKQCKEEIQRRDEESLAAKNKNNSEVKKSTCNGGCKDVVSKLKEELVKAETHYKKLLSSKKNLEEELGTKEAEIKKLEESHVVMMKEKISKMDEQKRKELESYKATLADQFNRVVSAKQTEIRAKYDEELEAARSNILSLEEKLSDVQNSYLECCEERNRIEAQLNASWTKRMKEAVKEKEVEISNLSQFYDSTRERSLIRTVESSIQTEAIRAKDLGSTSRPESTSQKEIAELKGLIVQLQSSMKKEKKEKKVEEISNLSQFYDSAGEKSLVHTVESSVQTEKVALFSKEIQTKDSGPTSRPVSTSQSEIAELKGLIVQLQSSVKKDKDVENDIGSIKVDYEKRLRTKEDLIKKMSQEIDDHKQEINRLLKSCDTLEEIIRNIESETRENTEEELVTFVKNIAEKSGIKCEKSFKDGWTWKQKLGHLLEKSLDLYYKCTSERENFYERLRKVKKRVDEMEKESITYISLNGKLQDDNLELMKQVEEANGVVLDLKKQLKEAMTSKRDGEHIMANLDKGQQRVRAAEEGIKVAMDSIDAQKKAFQERENKLKEENQRLASALDKLTEENAKLTRGSQKRLKEMSDSMEREKEEAVKQFKELLELKDGEKKILHDVLKQLECKKQKEVSDLQLRVRHLTTENNALRTSDMGPLLENYKMFVEEARVYYHGRVDEADEAIRKYEKAYERVSKLVKDHYLVEMHNFLVKTFNTDLALKALPLIQRQLESIPALKLEDDASSRVSAKDVRPPSPTTSQSSTNSKSSTSAAEWCLGPHNIYKQRSDATCSRATCSLHSRSSSRTRETCPKKTAKKPLKRA